MAKKSTTRKQYGRRAEGQTQTSISLSEETLLKARQAAGKQGTTLSKLIEEILKAGIKLILWLSLFAKLIQDPTDWTGGALAGSLGQGCAWFGQGLYFCASIGWNLFA